MSEVALAMIDQHYSGSYDGKINIDQQHLMSGELDESDTDIEESDKLSARRKIEDKLEERRLKRLTQDFDFDDL